MKIYYNGTCYSGAIYNGKAVYCGRFGMQSLRFVNDSTTLRLTGDGNFRFNN